MPCEDGSNHIDDMRSAACQLPDGFERLCLDELLLQSDPGGDIF
jgi:hypothetical protein